MEAVTSITYEEGITVGELAQKMNRNASDIIKLLFMLGKMVTINSSMDDETIELVCMEYGVEVKKEIPVDQDSLEDEIEENTCFALVSETQTEMLKLVYGNLRQGSLTVQVQNHICEPFDRIRIGEKLYTVDFIRKLRTKQVLVLSEVQ